MFFGIIMGSGDVSMALFLASYLVALRNSFHSPSAALYVRTILVDPGACMVQLKIGYLPPLT